MQCVTRSLRSVRIGRTYPILNQLDKPFSRSNKSETIRYSGPHTNGNIARGLHGLHGPCTHYGALRMYEIGHTLQSTYNSQAEYTLGLFLFR
jgi:hypothetical protein